MNKYLAIIIIVVLVVLSSSVLASAPSIESPTYDYQADTGLFNPARSSTCGTTGLQGLTCELASPGDFLFPPLTSDLDGDGQEEVVYYADNLLGVYEPVTLDLISALTPTNFSTPSRAYMILYDIDGDTYVEIIVAESTEDIIAIYNYNGSHVTYQNSMTIHENAAHLHSTGDYILSCAGQDQCMAFYHESIEAVAASDQYLYAQFFNSSGAYNSTPIQETSAASATTTVCFPLVPSVAVGNLDGDSDTEWYLVNTENDYSAGVDQSEIIVTAVSYDAATGAVVKEWQSKDAESYTPTDQNEQCAASGARPDRHENIGKRVTSPIIIDTNGGGDALVYALQTDLQEIKWKKVSGAGVITTLGVTVLDGDLVGMSNAVGGNFRPSSDQEDACVAVWQNTSLGAVMVSCYSGDASGDKTQEYSLSLTGYYNVTFQDRTFQEMIHASDQYYSIDSEVVLVAAEDINELVSTYGTLKIDNTFINELQLVWHNPKENGAVMMSDTENNALGDYILATSGNLWYLDDNLYNQPAQIDPGADETYIDPCTSTAWDINTTFKIAVKVTDPEGDQVSARLTIYKDSPYEQSTPWTTNASSGTVFLFTSGTLLINKTITGSTIYVEARDPEDNFGIIDTWVVPLNVQAGGVKEGDCKTYFQGDEVGGGTTPPGGDCASDDDCTNGYYCGLAGTCVQDVEDEDNAVTGAVKSASRAFNIPVIFILIIICIALIYAAISSDISMTAKTALVFMIPIAVMGCAGLFGLVSILWFLIPLVALLFGGSIAMAVMFRGGS